MILYNRFLRWRLNYNFINGYLINYVYYLHNYWEIVLMYISFININNGYIKLWELQSVSNFPHYWTIKTHTRTAEVTLELKPKSRKWRGVDNSTKIKIIVYHYNNIGLLSVYHSSVAIEHDVHDLEKKEGIWNTCYLLLE